MSEYVMVQNISDNDVIYIDDNGGVSRRIVFRSQQTLPLDRDTINRMRYDTGGSRLIKDYLSVKDDQIRNEIGVPEDQVEYDYTEDDVLELLRNNDYDGIADALDFGPLAIKEMIANKAVELPISNRNIMVLITEKTGKDVETMIRNKEEFEKANNTAKDEKQEAAPKVTSARRKAKPTPAAAEISKEDIAEIAAQTAARRNKQ